MIRNRKQLIQILTQLEHGAAAMEVMVEHCGHPTALWPWMLFVNGELIVSPNGLAWQKKKYAQRAAELIKAGKLKIFDPGRSQFRRAGFGPRQAEITQAWNLIGMD